MVDLHDLVFESVSVRDVRRELCENIVLRSVFEEFFPVIGVHVCNGTDFEAFYEISPTSREKFD